MARRRARHVLGAAADTGFAPDRIGNVTGTITNTKNGNGTMTLTINQPGTVFSGTATVAFPGNTDNNAFVGFVVNSTTAQFGVIGNGTQQQCNPFGLITISGNTLNGKDSNAGDASSGCTATGTFSLSK